MEKLKADEIGALCISMKALDRVNKFEGEIVTAYEKQLIANHEIMKPQDISDFYYCFTKAL